MGNDASRVTVVCVQSVSGSRPGRKVYTVASAPVKVWRVFRQPPEVEEVMLRLLPHSVCVGGPFKIVSDVYVEELEDSHLLHCGVVDGDRGCAPSGVS